MTPTISARISGVKDLTQAFHRHVVYVRPPTAIWMQAIAAVLLLSFSVSLWLPLVYPSLRLKGLVVLSRRECILWFAATWIAGYGLLAYFGENVNFVLEPQPWANIVAITVFVAVNALFWSRFRRRIVESVGQPKPPLE